MLKQNKRNYLTRKIKKTSLMKIVTICHLIMGMMRVLYLTVVQILRESYLRRIPSFSRSRGKSSRAGISLRGREDFCRTGKVPSSADLRSSKS